MKFRGTSFALKSLPVAIAAALSTTAFADSQDATNNDVTLLNQVTVTATRTEKSLKDVASSVAVIDDDQIESQLVQNINDLIRYEPGITVSNDSRTGFGDFTIRGMSGNRVKVIVDGVDQASAFDPGVTYYMRGGRNFIDTETLKGAEVVKGPASSLYGSDAIGGLVAFQTKNPEDLLNESGDDTHASVKAAYSSANEGFTETFSLANRTGDLESMVIYTRRDSKETDSYVNHGNNVSGSQRGQNNPAINRVDNLLSKINYDLNDNHRIGFTGEYQDNRSSVDVEDSTITQGVTGKDNKERIRLGVSHQWSDADTAVFDHMKWQLDWQKTSTDMVTFVPSYAGHHRTYDNREQNYTYQEKGYQFGAQFEKELTLANQVHSLTYGLNLTRDEVTNESNEASLDSGRVTPKDYIPTVDREIYGLFLQDEIALTDKLTVTPGVRWDKYEYKPSILRTNGEQTKDSGDSAVTGRLATVYKLTDNYSLFGQFSQGFKAPDLIDMFYTLDRQFLYKNLANPDLKPETSNSFEAGVRGHGRYGDFEVTAFYSRYEDFIATVSTASPQYPMGGISQAQNLAKARIKGLEFKGELFLDQVNPSLKDFTLRASLAYAEGEGKNNDSYEPLNNISPLTAVFGLAYDAPSGKWGNEALWTLVKGKDKSDINDPRNQLFATPGYGVVDLTAYYKPTDKLTLRAGLFNLTDKKYWNWDQARTATTSVNLDRYTQPGRNLSVSAKYTF